jgi:hypothetical protein
MADIEVGIGSASFYPPFKCRALKMFVNADTTPGIGQSFQYTLYVGGSATSITVTNSGIAGSDCQDITHVVAIPDPAGPSTAARLALQLVTSAGAVVCRHRVTIQLVKDD